MSVGLYPKDSLTMNQAIKVQELCIKGSDSSMYSVSGGNTFINVNEPVGQVYIASCKVDSTNLVTQFAQANTVIVDSTAHTAGGDQKAIELVGLAAVAANDCIIVRYVVLEHL